jgi:hypothetical protein
MIRETGSSGRMVALILAVKDSAELRGHGASGVANAT